MIVNAMPKFLVKLLYIMIYNELNKTNKNVNDFEFICE